MVYLFKIKLKGITKPPVWRKVSVSGNITFLQFHRVIQIVFGWENDHLFEFKDKEYRSNLRIAIPHEDDFDFFTQVYDASETKLSEIFSDKVKKLLYVYDFGDNWVHEITLESVSKENPNTLIAFPEKGPVHRKIVEAYMGTSI